MDTTKNGVIVDMDRPRGAEEFDNLLVRRSDGDPCRGRAEAEVVAVEFTRDRSQGGRPQKPT